MFGKGSGCRRTIWRSARSGPKEAPKAIAAALTVPGPQGAEHRRRQMLAIESRTPARAASSMRLHPVAGHSPQREAVRGAEDDDVQQHAPQ